MRQIFLDTETTGLKPPDHRVIEIGCIEVIDRKITGKQFHYYINPRRSIEASAFAVHGIDEQKLADKPFFEDIADELIAFLKDSEVLIHNAGFDVGFLDSEFNHVGRNVKMDELCEVVDTLKVARKLRPRQKNSLDALCQAYAVNNQHRTLHGALLDAELLADVYLAMTAGQNQLDVTLTEENLQKSAAHVLQDGRRHKKVIQPTDCEMAALKSLQEEYA